MSSDLAPYATHPTMPQFHGMVAESDRELGLVGAKARRVGIRLSFHPSQYVLLNSPDPELTRKSIEDLASQWVQSRDVNASTPKLRPAVSSPHL